MEFLLFEPDESLLFQRAEEKSQSFVKRFYIFAEPIPSRRTLK